MAFVLDASIALAWAFNEGDPTADAVRDRLGEEPALVPSLWWFELRNGLVVGERRHRLSGAQVDRFLREIADAVIMHEPLPDEATVMTLARRHGLTVYDAAYLELALRERLPLATLDAALAAAARQEGIAVLGVPAG